MTKQTHDEIVAGYVNPDPWGYKTCPADIERKSRIIEACREEAHGGKFERALDIACGEGWITGDLPAREIHGYELSTHAAFRFPKNVKDTNLPISGVFDLVLCTGALYAHYNWELFVAIMKTNASKVIVTCSIADWEHVPAIDSIKRFANLTSVDWFDYERPEAKYVQVLRVFRL